MPEALVDHLVGGDEVHRQVHARKRLPQGRGPHGLTGKNNGEIKVAFFASRSPGTGAEGNDPHRIGGGDEPIQGREDLLLCHRPVEGGVCCRHTLQPVSHSCTRFERKREGDYTGREHGCPVVPAGGAGKTVGASPLFIWPEIAQDDMFDVDQIRAVGQRVAASHGLDVVEIEFHGGAKHRMLRVFIEKNAEERGKLAAAQAKSDPGVESNVAAASGTGEAGLDQLAGITHEDCEAFSRDFGTVLDVEDLIPGSEYTLEVSSPGLDRKLHGAEDFRRFQGLLAKVQTFEPVAGNRHWQGRLRLGSDTTVRLQIEGKNRARGKQGKGNRAQSAEENEVEIALSNIEKAQLVPEF